MNFETEGVVLRQIKIMDDKRMLILFTEKKGKIPVGFFGNMKLKNKNNSAISPFTHSRYEIQKKREYYNVQQVSVIKNFHMIGENIDKYMACSYGLEFVDKISMEHEANPKLFRLFLSFLKQMELRKKEYLLMVLAFQLKALDLSGFRPELNRCTKCGSKEHKGVFNVETGGLLCENCVKLESPNLLIKEASYDIIGVIDFILNKPMEELLNLSLQKDILLKLHGIVKEYTSYHTGIESLKCEAYL